MIYGSWNIRCDRQTDSPSTIWEIKILTLKKTPRAIIILHIFTINCNHMMYGSWDKEHDRHNFLSFWTIFCPFTPLWTHKIKIKKKRWKKHLKILSFYKHKSQSYDVWFLRYGLQWTEFFVILDHFLAFYPITTSKIKIWKNDKNTLRYYHFMHVYHKWVIERDGQHFLSFWTFFFALLSP